MRTTIEERSAELTVLRRTTIARPCGSRWTAHQASLTISPAVRYVVLRFAASDATGVSTHAFARLDDVSLTMSAQ